VSGSGGPVARDQDGARTPEAIELFDRLGHEALEVTGVAKPDVDEPEEDVLTGVELEVVEVDACVVFWLASAGS
jgi:hypothetical protein